ncbi:MAG: cytochrome c [Paracoccaceae bacterium]|nr:cytochrome c [Paracoccaceae bacterium]
MLVAEVFSRAAGRTGLKMCLGGTAIVLALGSSAYAEEELIGADEYRHSCLACHGVGGKGDGPMADFLTVRPSDLTQIAKANDGDFPLSDIYRVIDGRTDVGAHGVRSADGWEMPVWGSRYSAEADDMLDPIGPGEQAKAERLVRGRVLELAYYLQEIQDK